MVSGGRFFEDLEVITSKNTDVTMTCLFAAFLPQEE
jgi:hypothetical protein